MVRDRLVTRQSELATVRAAVTADLQPHLKGELIELRPLRADDWETLYQIASDPLIWEQHPNHDRHKPDVFRQFFDGAMASGGALVAIDRQTQRTIGSSRMVWFDAEQTTIEIGWTFLARAYWGGAFNGEMKRLMLAHAFTFADRVVFVIGAENRRSRQAIERVGAVLTPRTATGLDANGRPSALVIYEIVNPRSKR